MSSSQLTSYLTVKTESFSSEIRHKTKLSTLTTFIQLSFGSPVQIHQAMKRKSESKSERKRQNWHYVHIEKWSVSRSVVSDSVTTRTAACQAPLPIGILQARILEWVAIPSSRVSSRPRDQTRVSCIPDGFFAIRVMRKETPLHDITYRNPKDFTKNMRNNTLSKVVEWKTYIQKSVAFLCTNNKTAMRRNWENNSIYICMKMNKISRNKFNQGGERPVHLKL